MSSLTTLARPYAKAAFELAQTDVAYKGGNLAGWDDMLSAVSAVTDDADMASWLQSHITSRAYVRVP